MNLIGLPPIPALREAWKRLWGRRGDAPKGAAGRRPKQSRVSKPNHRHAAFLELP